MLSVEPIKAFTDNYIWLVSTNEGSIVIDPGESKNIQKLIDNKTIDLKGILITHHHYDHTNGLSELVKINELEVYGPVNNIDGINHRLTDKDKISIIGIDFDVISIPGHTLDHIGFYSANANNPILFCGDTLFAEVSATTKKNLDKLKENIILQTDLLDLKDDYDSNAEGVILESRIDKGKGPVSTVLVTNGILKKGDYFVSGKTWGKIRAMINFEGKNGFKKIYKKYS